ncbi:hypothetical protein [Labrenzia sp. DG1229]|uniref:hypothetical protein n=1 Tax=Labrenzia sp. DG1229 TaxID=681847 RepID=UPI000490251D|nr:hypothetical protein [Labrenzia sp. DG1229]
MTPFAAIALQVGATAISGLLRRRGGEAGKIVADVADNTVVRVAQSLGVAPTEQAISDLWDKDPSAVTEAIHQVDAELGEMAKAASEATQSYHDLIKEDRESASLLTRIWRPLNGVLFAWSCLALIMSFCYLMMTGDVQTIANASVAYGFLGTVLGTWAGVVGVYVWRRTDEKKAGST